MHDEIKNLRDRTEQLQADVERASTGDRDPLFNSRSELKELGERLNRSAWRHATPICGAVETLLEGLLRSGGLDEDQTVQVAGDMLQLLYSILDMPAPAVGGFKLTRGSAPVTGAMAPDLDYRPKGNSIQLDLGEVNETRVGEILVRMGRLDSDDLTQALALQQVTRGRLGEVLVNRGYITQNDLDMALEEQRQATLRLAGDLAADRGGLELRVSDLGETGS